MIPDRCSLWGRYPKSLILMDIESPLNYTIILRHNALLHQLCFDARSCIRIDSKCFCSLCEQVPRSFIMSDSESHTQPYYFYQPCGLLVLHTLRLDNHGLSWVIQPNWNMLLGVPDLLAPCEGVPVSLIWTLKVTLEHITIICHVLCYWKDFLMLRVCVEIINTGKMFSNVQRMLEFTSQPLFS